MLYVAIDDSYEPTRINGIEGVVRFAQTRGLIEAHTNAPITGPLARQRLKEYALYLSEAPHEEWVYKIMPLR